MRKKMSTKYYDRLNQFLKGTCPYPYHWCDGTPKPNKDGQTGEQREPCEYRKFAGTLKSGCTHPKRG
jgi:hypothetical protein